jgi:hypothetical protein
VNPDELGEVALYGKALSHPLRLKIMALAEEGPTSPVMVSRLVDVALGVSSYHCSTLVKLGCLDLSRTQPRRGTLEHFYIPTDRGRDVLRIADEIVYGPPKKEEAKDEEAKDEEGKDDDPSS